MSNLSPKGAREGNSPRGLSTVPLSAIRAEPLEWLAPDLIPLGRLTVLAGEGGVGKSTLLSALAADVTRGRPAFGLAYPPAAPADVLLIGCEDDLADTVAPRLLAAGADRDRVHAVNGAEVTDARGTVVVPFDLSRANRLAEELADRPGVRLVVIDPANAFLPPGVDEHRDAELRTVLGPLADAAARARVAVVLVKHLNKSAGVPAAHRVAGSAGWVNAARSALLVASDPAAPDRRLLLPLKANHGPGAAGVAFRIEALPRADAARLVSTLDGLAAAGRERLAAQLVTVRWDGPARVSADEVLADGPRPTRVGECERWLRDFVGGYAWPDAELKAAASDAGFTADNLKDAKARLRRGVPALVGKARGRGGAWWVWFGDTSKPPPDRPHPTTPNTPETPHTPETPDTPEAGMAATEPDPHPATGRAGSGGSGDHSSEGPHTPETPDTPECHLTRDAGERQPLEREETADKRQGAMGSPGSVGSVAGSGTEPPTPASAPRPGGRSRRFIE